MIKTDLEFEFHLGFLPDFHHFISTNIEEEKLKEFNQFWRMFRLYLTCIENNLEKFSWKYLIENGKFCEHDFKEDRFKDWLAKEGYASYEEASKIYEEKCKEKELNETTK